MRRHSIAHLSQWFGFTVIFSLAPLLIRAGILIVDGHTVTLTVLLEEGDLLVIAVVLAADCIGQMLEQKWHPLKTFTAVLCGAVLILGSSIDALIRVHHSFVPSALRNCSLGVFGIAVVCSGYSHFSESVY